MAVSSNKSSPNHTNKERVYLMYAAKHEDTFPAQAHQQVLCASPERGAHAHTDIYASAHTHPFYFFCWPRPHLMASLIFLDIEACSAAQNASGDSLHENSSNNPMRMPGGRTACQPCCCPLQNHPQGSKRHLASD